MNDNVPPSWTTPPWDQPEQVKFEQEIEDAIQETRSALADELPDLIWNLIREATSQNDVRLAVYDDLINKAKKLWENG